MRARRLARPVAGAAVLAVLVWRLGYGPFLDGIRDVDARALAAAGAIGLLTTMCCAWRWTIVARGLGIPLPLSAAVAAYYRSVFLNLTLPGGVVGDVHRGVRHGRDVGDVARALRAVAWERGAGQLVQIVLTIALLFALPSPVRSWMPLVAVAAVAVAAAAFLACRRSALVRADARAWLHRRDALPVAVASTAVVAGHALTFVVAARTVGVDAPVDELLPLALFAMAAMVLPSIAGWGPREGATAWVFAAAGLGADRGIATGAAFGVLALAASLPGALVLAAGWMPRSVAMKGAMDG